jgi:hypothetical protein
MHKSSSLTLRLSLLILGLGSASCGQAADSRDDSPAADGDTGFDAAGSMSRPFPAQAPAGQAGRGGDSAVDPSPDAAPVAGRPGRADSATAAPAADSTAPVIVSVQPANGAVGVRANARVIVEFSEPMNRTATLDAFASEALRSDQRVMTWNEAGTILTIEPAYGLEYAHAELAGAAPLELEPKTFAYTLTRAATDLAGNPLAETTVAFSTLREVTHTLTPVPELTGVVADHDELHGFLTLDVGQLPAGILELERAVARTSDYLVTDAVQVFHVAFDQLSPSAIGARPATLIATLPRGTSGGLTIPPATCDFLAADYVSRSEARHYSQVRFDVPTAHSQADARGVEQLLRDASVELEYLLP